LLDKCWEPKWRRNFFSWEEELVKQLLALTDYANESWVYRFDSGGMYNVKSHYMYLYKKKNSSASFSRPGHSSGGIGKGVEKLDTVKGYSILMVSTSWSNSNKIKLSTKGNHPTRVLGLLHLLCSFFENGKSSLC
jgi:hypothetical protein